MEPPSLGDAFDGGDVLPFAGYSQHEAAVLGLAVYEDRAGPAHTEVASLLGSCQPQLVPEDIQERLSIADCGRVFLSVDPELDDALGIAFSTHVRNLVFE
jgi:hypothetical protein